jgi:hypothetical protein
MCGPIAWGAAALWFDGPTSRPVAGTLAALFAAGSFSVLGLMQSLWRGAALVSGALVVVLVWWLGIEPRIDRPWQPDVAHLPIAEINGDVLTIRNVRSFAYRSETDYTPRWETRTYDLTKIRGLDLFMSYWGPRVIAHTILSWQFEEGEPLAVSIETRKEEGEQYSAILGFFRRFELYYVLADERDVVRLRTNFRGEDVYLYRLRTPPARARKLLLDYLDKVNSLANRATWYNAFTHNCTTTIVRHVRDLDLPFAWHWKMFANGYLDERLYEQGIINSTLPFEQLRSRSAISSVAKTIENIVEFPRLIRVGLPDRPPPPQM